MKKNKLNQETYAEKKEKLALEHRRYAKTILTAPSYKNIKIYLFDVYDQKIINKADSLKSFNYKKIVRARNEKGYFAPGWALVCCK